MSRRPPGGSCRAGRPNSPSQLVELDPGNRARGAVRPVHEHHRIVRFPGPEEDRVFDQRVAQRIEQSAGQHAVAEVGVDAVHHAHAPLAIVGIRKRQEMRTPDVLHGKPVGEAILAPARRLAISPQRRVDHRRAGRRTVAAGRILLGAIDLFQEPPVLGADLAHWQGPAAVEHQQDARRRKRLGVIPPHFDPVLPRGLRADRGAGRGTRFRLEAEPAAGRLLPARRRLSSRCGSAGRRRGCGLSRSAKRREGPAACPARMTWSIKSTRTSLATTLAPRARWP